MSMDRQCSSGMMAIATAAKGIMVDDVPIAIAGGAEQISLVQNEHANHYRRQTGFEKRYRCVIVHMCACIVSGHNRKNPPER